MPRVRRGPSCLASTARGAKTAAAGVRVSRAESGDGSGRCQGRPAPASSSARLGAPPDDSLPSSGSAKTRSMQGQPRAVRSTRAPIGGVESSTMSISAQRPKPARPAIEIMAAEQANQQRVLALTGQAERATGVEQTGDTDSLDMPAVAPLVAMQRPRCGVQRSAAGCRTRRGRNSMTLSPRAMRAEDEHDARTNECIAAAGGGAAQPRRTSGNEDRGDAAIRLHSTH